MEIKFNGRVILVTGSTKGIGKAIALFFAKAGGSVIINSRHEAEVANTVNDFKKNGFNAFGFTADVGNVEAIDSLARKIMDAVGRIDILVNNAGISFPIVNNAEELEIKDWDHILRTNLSGPFYLAKTCIPFIRKSGGGSIINIGSTSYLIQTESPNIAYSATKGGLVSLTRALAKNCAPYGIRVNIINPWCVKTEKTMRVFDKINITMEDMARKNPLGRIAVPEDVASLALFLASDYANFITGQVIHVSGAIELARK